MSKEYIARDPRTGKPLNVARSKSKKQYIDCLLYTSDAADE